MEAHTGRLIATVVLVALAVVATSSRAMAQDTFEEFFKGRQKEPSIDPAPTARARGASRDAVAPTQNDSRTIAPPLPGFALELGAGLGYHMWLAGKLANQDIGNVFKAGPGVGFTLGIRLGSMFKLYGGFTQVGTPVGDQSPYVAYDESSAFVRTMYGGFQANLSDAMVSPVLDVAVGVTKLHQEAKDKAGSSASIDFSSVTPRLGAGVHVRPSRYLGLTPLLTFSLMPVSSYSSSITIQGANSSQEGSLASSSVLMLMGLSVEGVFALPLSKE